MNVMTLLSRVFGQATDSAPEERPVLKAYFNPGMDAPYDFDLAVKAARAARVREVKQRKLAAERAKPVTRKPRRLYVVPMQKTGSR